MTRRCMATGQFKRFGARTDIIGRVIRVDGEPH